MAARTLEQPVKIDVPDPDDTVDEDTPQVFRVMFRGDDLGTFSHQRMTTSESILMKQRTGVTTKQFLEGLGELDGAAYKALVWLLKFRRGETVDFAALEFEFGDLRIEKEPDPTHRS